MSASPSVSLYDMQRVATGLSTNLSDIQVSTSADSSFGNLIDIPDLPENDSYGLGLLSNSRFPPQQQQQQQQVQFVTENHDTPPITFTAPSGGGGSYGGGMQEVDITHLEPLEPITFDIPAISGGSEPFHIPAINITHEQSQSQSPFTTNSPQPSVNLTGAQRDVNKELNRKKELIKKFARLEAKGFPIIKRFTKDDPLEEMEEEMDRLTDVRNLERAVTNQKRMMSKLTHGLEYVGENVSWLNMDFTGLSDAVEEQKEEFDDIYEDMYDKWKGRGNLPPEVRLAWALGSTALEINMTNKFLRQMPGAEKIFHDNPELARQFMAAAMAGTPGQAPAQMAHMYGAGSGGGAQPQMADPGPGVGAFFGSGSGTRLPQTAMPVQVPQSVAAESSSVPRQRKEMKGPSGVEDILQTFKEVRQAEADGFNMAAFMSPPPQSVAAQPAVLAAELQSLHSEEFGTSVTGSRRGGGGRRRKGASIPTENTIVMDL